jgi:hypothetical protein
MRLCSIGFAALLGSGIALAALPSDPASAQSTGYVTGFPGKDPAGDDEIGWGPAYRPETSFSQPGTPPTPGDFAGAAYRARTGRGPYDAVQGGDVTGTIGSGSLGRAGRFERAPRTHRQAARAARRQAHHKGHHPAHRRAASEALR